MEIKIICNDENFCHGDIGQILKNYSDIISSYAFYQEIGEEEDHIISSGIMTTKKLSNDKLVIKIRGQK